jgi:hypothetical protein
MSSSSDREQPEGRERSPYNDSLASLGLLPGEEKGGAAKGIGFELFGVGVLLGVLVINSFVLFGAPPPPPQQGIQTCSCDPGPFLDFLGSRPILIVVEASTFLTLVLLLLWISVKRHPGPVQGDASTNEPGPLDWLSLGTYSAKSSASEDQPQDEAPSPPRESQSNQR